MTTDERSASVRSSSQLATPTRVHFDQSHPVTVVEVLILGYELTLFDSLTYHTICLSIYKVVCLFVCPLITREQKGDCLQIFSVAAGHSGMVCGAKSWR